jgi:hypothetical protein
VAEGYQKTFCLNRGTEAPDRMLCLWTEGPYGSGLQVKKLGREEKIHESKGHNSVHTSSVSVLVSQFASDCSLSESNNKYHRFGYVSTAHIDVGGSVK